MVLSMLLPLPDAQASVRSIREGDDESVVQEDVSDENQNLGHDWLLLPVEEHNGTCPQTATTVDEVDLFDVVVIELLHILTTVHADFNFRVGTVVGPQFLKLFDEVTERSGSDVHLHVGFRLGCFLISYNILLSRPKVNRLL